MKLIVAIVVAAGLGSAVGLGLARREFHASNDFFEPYKTTLTTLGGGDQDDGLLEPRVEVVNGETYDFGTMDVMSKGERVFLFRNSGTAPLTLKLRSTSCKCTVGKLEEDMVEPGQTVDVRLEWKVDSNQREFQQTAEIETTDPNRKFVTLIVRGAVTYAVMAEPKEIYVGDVRPSADIATRVRLLGFRSSDMKVVSADWGNQKQAEFFDHRIVAGKPTDAELAQYPGLQSAIDVEVLLKPGLPIGPINQTIRLVTNVEKAPMLEIPIQGTVVSDVSVFGGGGDFRTGVNLLQWGVVKSDLGRESKLNILVKGEAAKDVQIEVGEVDPADVLQVEIGERLERSSLVQFPMTVRLPKGMLPVNRLGSDQAKYGRILLKTTHPDAKEIVIFVAFAVER